MQWRFPASDAREKLARLYPAQRHCKNDDIGNRGGAMRGGDPLNNRAGAMQNPASELPRILIPRTPVNRGLLVRQPKSSKRHKI